MGDSQQPHHKHCELRLWLNSAFTPCSRPQSRPSSDLCLAESWKLLMCFSQASSSSVKPLLLFLMLDLVFPQDVGSMSCHAEDRFLSGNARQVSFSSFYLFPLPDWPILILILYIVDLIWDQCFHCKDVISDIFVPNLKQHNVDSTQTDNC